MCYGRFGEGFLTRKVASPFLYFKVYSDFIPQQKKPFILGFLFLASEFILQIIGEINGLQSDVQQL